MGSLPISKTIEEKRTLKNLLKAFSERSSGQKVSSVHHVRVKWRWDTSDRPAGLPMGPAHSTIWDHLPRSIVARTGGSLLRGVAVACAFSGGWLK